MKITIEEILNSEIRALSWKQPFASLMLHGKIETRVWDTKYRGLVLICASKAPYSGDALVDISGDQWPRILIELEDETMVTAQAIAIGRLVNSRLMNCDDEDKCFVQYSDPWTVNKKYLRFKHNEISNRIVEYFEYKEVTKRLWCHEYADVTPIEHFDWKGSQGWSTLTPEQKQLIKLI